MGAHEVLQGKHAEDECRGPKRVRQLLFEVRLCQSSRDYGRVADVPGDFVGLSGGGCGDEPPMHNCGFTVYTFQPCCDVHFSSRELAREAIFGLIAGFYRVDVGARCGAVDGGTKSIGGEKAVHD